MRSIHPLHPSVLLLAAALAAPLHAQLPGGLRPVAPAAVQRTQLTVEASHLQSLQARLNGFASGLTAEEGALWDDVLRRAATAPAGGGDVRVSPILQIGPGGGCDDTPGVDDAANRVAIIVQGGRTAGSSGIVVQGGRAPSGIIVQGGRTPGGQGADAPRPNPAGVVAIGPKQDDPSRPGRTGAEAIGPKQDDPGAPRPGSVVAIGPKQDDPAPPPQSLGRRVADFSASLSPQERGALEWLLTRAASAPEGRPGTPGGLPPGPCNPERGCRPPVGGSPLSVSLRQALGIDAVQGSRTPSSATRWTLRY